ncbi:cytochrome P450 [Cladochytrium replicatum]|nr:cytochrome P450 [Cladochytrium replicatum]
MAKIFQPQMFLISFLLGALAAVITLFVLVLRSKAFRVFFMRNFASTKYLPHPTLPGPPVLPILGSFLNYLNYLETGENHIASHNILVERSKDGVLLTQNFVLGRKMVTTGDPELARIILSKGVRPGFFRKLDGKLITDALFMMGTDDIWKNHRKGIQPGFGPSHLRRTFGVTNNATKILVDGINAKVASAKAKDKPLVLEVMSILSSLTLDVLAQVAFSADFGSLEYILENDETSPDFKHLGQIFGIVYRRSSIPKTMWKLFGLAESDVEAVRQHVYGYVERLLAERIEKNAKGEGETDKRELDVMDRLLAKDEDGNSRFSNQEIVDELLGFMLAGQDTTANTMTWFLLELSRNPDLAEELEAEIDAFYNSVSVVDKLTLSETAFEALQAQCPKLESFFKEVQRFHPVVAAVARNIPEKDVNLAGHVIEGGTSTMFLVHIVGLHFNERYWKDPKTFNPSRWSEAPAPGSFLPFGDGPHNCIGRKMAVIEAMTVLAALIRHFRFRLIPGQHLLGKTAVTTGPRDGLLLEITARPH